MKYLRIMTLGIFVFTLCACGGGGTNTLPGAGNGTSGGGATAPIAPPESSPSALLHACPPPSPGYMTCYALIRGDGTTIQPMLEHMLSHRNDAAAYSGPLRPSDIASVYGLPAQPSAGAIPTVAIVDAFDDPNAEADLSHYRQWFHLPPCTSANGCFKKLNAAGITGSYPAANAGWAGEIALDLDVASATCPACRIVLVEAADNGAGSLAAAEDTAASLHPSAISNSYGGAEYENASAHYDHPNTMIVASTGDDSYYGGPQQPASYGTVIAVGGTSLYRDAARARGWDEFAWSNGGSGCSKLVARPSWQDPNVTGCGKRAVADVAAFADPFNPGVWVWNTYAGTAGGAGGWYVDGGTSAAAPLIAGIYALAGNTATLGGSYARGIYASPASSFFDITEGNNGYCTPTVQCAARAGYDEPTGRGSPNGLGAF